VTRWRTLVTPERMLLAGLVVLFVVFFVILIVQPTSVGRGGR
jgi:type II secretory pathway component PulM